MLVNTQRYSTWYVLQSRTIQWVLCRFIFFFSLVVRRFALQSRAGQGHPARVSFQRFYSRPPDLRTANAVIEGPFRPWNPAHRQKSLPKTRANTKVRRLRTIFTRPFFFKQKGLRKAAKNILLFAIESDLEIRKETSESLKGFENINRLLKRFIITVTLSIYTYRKVKTEDKRDPRGEGEAKDTRRGTGKQDSPSYIAKGVLAQKWSPERCQWPIWTLSLQLAGLFEGSCHYSCASQRSWQADFGNCS